MFDRVVIVDWSARSSPSPERPTADAIWIGEAGRGETYLRTRAAAEADLAARITAAVTAGDRLLVGFDFPFGYPAGFTGALGCDTPLQLWDWLAARIRDDAANANNRFHVAAALNRLFPGIGPFWGRPAALDLPDLPARGTLRHGHGLPERRAVEGRVRTAQPVWKLFTTGSVGSQTLLGLPVLSRLRRLPCVSVWPFEPLAQVVLAEVWPSLLSGHVAAERDDAVKDRVQVRVLARELHRLAREGRLAPLFDVPPAATVEGWILGVGHEATLRNPPGAGARTSSKVPASGA